MLRQLATFGALVALLSGCIRGEPIPQIGVARQGEDVEVFYGRCKQDRVMRVSIRVVEPDDKGGIVTGPVIWEIRSEEGSKVDQFVVGVTPPDFETIVPAKEPFPVNEQLSVSVKDSRFEGSIGVRIAAIKDGSVFFDGKSIPLEEFERQRPMC
jgi:hypothetical protein